jgi:hypothetical protein
MCRLFQNDMMPALWHLSHRMGICLLILSMQQSYDPPKKEGGRSPLPEYRVDGLRLAGFHHAASRAFNLVGSREWTHFCATMNRTTRLTGRTVKTVMSMVTMHFNVLGRLVGATATLARSMLFFSFMNGVRTSASVYFFWRWIFVYFTMHWRLNLTALFVSSAFHRMHGMLFNHVMSMMAVMVFTMHFVMFSHNLPLMLV